MLCRRQSVMDAREREKEKAVMSIIFESENIIFKELKMEENKSLMTKERTRMLPKLETRNHHFFSTRTCVSVFLMLS